MKDIPLAESGPPPRSPATLRQSLGRGVALLRYHRPSQLWRRAAKLALQYAGWPRPPRPHGGGDISLRESSAVAFAKIRARRLAAWGHRLEEWTGNLTTRTIRSLNHSHPFGDAIDWRLGRDQGVSDLWRFHLHYQDELLAALAEGDDVSRRRAAAHVRIAEWIDGNPPTARRRDAWHPFCISRRVINWILAWPALETHRNAAVRQSVLESLAAQVEFLRKNLEWDLRGNHLLVNLHALGLAGAFLGGAEGDRALESVERHLPGQLREQLLPSGEHFERSPMYHAQMLEAVLDLRDALTVVAPPLAAECVSAARRMAGFLERILHPDGKIPLLGDSVFDETPEPAILIGAAREPATDRESSAHNASNETGDCWTFRDETTFLLFDTGPVGADELPAHGHCDLLSFEASVHGQRLFVDSGIFDYEDSPLRRYGRSTAAHNVLQIDDSEQCDLWSKFRMGRRGKPVRRASGRTEEWSWCFASHNAYRRAGVPETGRWMAARGGGFWVAVESLGGAGPRTATLRWHLHPDVTATRESPTEWRLAVAGQSLVLALPAEGETRQERYPYCPEFGCRIDAAVLVWQTRRELPCRLLWSLRPAGTDLSARIECPSADTPPVVVIEAAGESTNIPLPL